MTTLDIREADVLRLLDRLLDGEDFVITREGTPVARLTSIEKPKSEPRRIGTLAGKFEVPPDSAFFDPLPDDVLATFYGEDRDDSEDPLLAPEKPAR